MPSKYNVSSNASKRTYEGIVYDSVLEMKFARDFIVPRVNSGTIISFDRQVKFELQPAFYYQGQRIRSIVYIADFVIQYSDGHVVVVDIKGMPDTAAKLKRKLFYYKFPDVDYKWVCYSRQDGGWIMYEELTKKRKERKKEKKRKEKEIKGKCIIRMKNNEYSSVSAWLDNKSVTLKVKKILNASEATTLFERVITSVYDADDEYLPQYFEYIWRRGVIEAYTDLVMPQTTDDAYLCCYSEIWDAVINVVSQDQLADIYEAVSSYIQRKEQRICYSLQFKELLNDINKITQFMLNMDHLPIWLTESMDAPDTSLTPEEMM